MVQIELLDDGGIVRLRAPGGRVLYVEARRDGAARLWFVHVDGCGRRAARSYPCSTREMAVYRVLSELYEMTSEAPLSAESASSIQASQAQPARTAGG